MTRRAAPCGCRWAGPRPTTRSTAAARCVPARHRAGAGGRAAPEPLARTATGPGRVSAWLSRPGPERVLVAMSGGVDSSVAAALVARSGADVVGVWMRLHDKADAARRPEAHLLLVRRGRGRAPGGRPAGHPVLHPEPGARVRGGRAGPVRGRLPRRPHAEPLHRLQHDGQVRGAPGPRPPPLRRAPGRDRPLRPGRGRDAATGGDAAGRRRPATRTRATSCTGWARRSWPTPGSRSAT